MEARRGTAFVNQLVAVDVHGQDFRQVSGISFLAWQRSHLFHGLLKNVGTGDVCVLHMYCTPFTNPKGFPLEKPLSSYA